MKVLFFTLISVGPEHLQLKETHSSQKFCWRMDGWMVRWLDGWMDGCMVVCMYVLYVCMYVLIDEWMDGCL